MVREKILLDMTIPLTLEEIYELHKFNKAEDMQRLFKELSQKTKELLKPNWDKKPGGEVTNMYFKFTDAETYDDSVGYFVVKHLGKKHPLKQGEIEDTDEPYAKVKKYNVSSEAEPGQPAVFAHGESPVWDPRRQCLYFVDVTRRNVHRLDYDSGKIHTKNIGYGQVNVVSLVGEASRVLVCARAGVYLLEWAAAGDAALRPLSAVDMGLPDNVINEAKPDSEGRYWAGTKGPQTGDAVLPDRASFYSLRQESPSTPRLHLRPVTISNGIAWSPNNSVLYYIDSPTRKIEAFDFDVRQGEISGRRTILDISHYGYKDAIPDGMTIDSSGGLWVAVMFGGAVIHIDPDRRQLVHEYKLPVSRVTSVAWGGPALDELFVTTSQNAEPLDAADEPLAGAIFTIRDTGYTGLPPNYFAFDNADSY